MSITMRHELSNNIAITTIYSWILTYTYNNLLINVFYRTKVFNAISNRNNFSITAIVCVY